jgi:hypothetical protein
MPQMMAHYHATNKHSCRSEDYAAKYAIEIQHWNNRLNYVQVGEQFNNNPPLHSTQYIDNYARQYHPYLSYDQFLNDPRPHPFVSQHHNPNQPTNQNYNTYDNPTQASSSHNQPKHHHPISLAHHSLTTKPLNHQQPAVS